MSDGKRCLKRSKISKVRSNLLSLAFLVLVLPLVVITPLLVFPLMSRPFLSGFNSVVETKNTTAPKKELLSSLRTCLLLSLTSRTTTTS